MLEYLCEWIQRIAYYMVLVTLIMQAAGEGYRKYIRLFTGIILILFILAPVIRLFGLDGEEFVLASEDGYEAAAERIKEKIQKLEGEAAAISGTESFPEALRLDGIGDPVGDAGEEEEKGKIEVGEIRIGR